MKHFVSLFLTIVLAACVHQPYKAPVVTPPPTVATVCDTVDVDYKTVIKPIFRNNCYSCHGTAVVNGTSLDLEDSASLKKYLELGFRGDGVYGSKLYHCILHSSLAQPMPPTYVLDTCSRLKIRHWLSMKAPM